MRTTDPSMELLFATAPDREKWVAELWWGNEMWGEVNQELPRLMVELYPHRTGEPWILPLEDVLRVLQRAGDELPTPSEDSSKSPRAVVPNIHQRVREEGSEGDEHTVELWIGEEMWAKLGHVSSLQVIELYPRKKEGRQPWVFPLGQLLDLLTRARASLSET